MTRRIELLHRLRTEAFDLLVIGGGIVGAGIARDAALRGLTVALIDKGDFASGTSSKTSKLIHGGLRYLEHGHLRLVFESLRERHILQTIAPQLVRPLSLMMPIYRGDPRPRWKIALGLALYDALAMGRNMHAHRMLSRRVAMRTAASLNSNRLRGAAVYTDCAMEDARLCLTNILQAISFGAVCCNYVRLRAFHHANGTLCGATVEDARNDETFEVRARRCVNATGPWSDAVRMLSDSQAGGRLAPTKGIHVLLPRLSEQALCIQTRHDRRMIFLLPWGEEYSLVGTTESPDVGDLDTLQATAQEIEYLLAEVNRAIPDAQARTSDIIATYAGARPLLAFHGASTRASREHRIEVDRFGLVSVLGGKYTTFRLMAQQALDVVLRQQRVRAERCLTDQISLLESTHPVALDRWQDVIRTIAPELLGRLLNCYGTGAFRILQLMEFDPALRSRVCPHHDVIYAECIHSMQEELACTISDWLIRRTPIALSACQGLDLLSSLGELLHRYGRMSHEEFAAQCQEYRAALAASLPTRPLTMPVLAS